MSYLVLARKYRPMFFEDVMGQQHVTKTLENAIRKQRIANAYLFSGPRGVGKTTVARLLSKALNCDKGPTVRPCNTCTSCVEINESRSLDVFEIDGASNRGIDEVRNLREGLKYSPNPGKYRIYIIDEVHMLTNEAFNALLKTLEEPPPRVLFIFATTEAHKVPATILSRTQRFDFKRISNKVIIEQLTLLCGKENIQIDDESLRLIANKADGSMRDSESILDQIIAFAGTDVRAADVMSLLGIIDSSLFFQVTGLVKTANVQGGVELANRIFLEGYDFSDFLNGLAQHFRNLLVAKTTKNKAILDLSDEQAKRYLEECEFFSMDDLLGLLKTASDAEYLVRKSPNARLHLEIALIKMVQSGKTAGQAQQPAKKKPLTPDTDTPRPSLPQPANDSSSYQPLQTDVPTRPESPAGTSAGPPEPAFLKDGTQVSIQSEGPPDPAPQTPAPSNDTEALPQDEGQPSNAAPEQTGPEPLSPDNGGFSASPHDKERPSQSGMPPETGSTPVPSQQQDIPQPDGFGLPDFDRPQNTPLRDISEVGLEEIQARWPGVVEYIKRNKIALGSFLEESVPGRLDGSTVHLLFGPQNGFHMASVQRNTRFVEKAFREVMGVDVRIICRKKEPKPDAEKKKEPLTKKEQFDILARENETVKLIVDVFQAEFVR